MAEGENKALYHRFFEEAVNQGSLEVVHEFIAPGYINYNFPVARGPDGVKQLIAWFRAAFPNMKMAPEEVFAAEATVIGRGLWQGTHRGVFQGIYLPALR